MVDFFVSPVGTHDFVKTESRKCVFCPSINGVASIFRGSQRIRICNSCASRRNLYTKEFARSFTEIYRHLALYKFRLFFMFLKHNKIEDGSYKATVEFMTIHWSQADVEQFVEKYLRFNWFLHDTGHLDYSHMFTPYDLEKEFHKLDDAHRLIQNDVHKHNSEIANNW